MSGWGGWGGGGGGCIFVKVGWDRCWWGDEAVAPVEETTVKTSVSE